jgi:hypothetical protein
MVRTLDLRIMSRVFYHCATLAHKEELLVSMTPLVDINNCVRLGMSRSEAQHQSYKILNKVKYGLFKQLSLARK